MVAGAYMAWGCTGTMGTAGVPAKSGSVAVAEALGGRGVYRAGWDARATLTPRGREAVRAGVVEGKRSVKVCHIVRAPPRGMYGCEWTWVLFLRMCELLMYACED